MNARRNDVASEKCSRYAMSSMLRPACPRYLSASPRRMSSTSFECVAPAEASRRCSVRSETWTASCDGPHLLGHTARDVLAAARGGSKLRGTANEAFSHPKVASALP